MARYSKDRKGETRRRIVDMASRQFRAGGVDGVGIASLMAEAGLTNGGFYAHFASKEDLVREAVVEALAGVSMDHGLVEGSGDADLRRFIDFYLSPAHRDNVAEGCAMAALVPELSRRPSAARNAFQASGKAMIDRIAEALPAPIGIADRLPQAFMVFSSMMGVLQMARFVSDKSLSDGILARGRVEALRLAGFGSRDDVLF